ncbi:MAG: hypothetical protein ACJ8AI_05890 [Rhodopila sp.]
MGRASDGKLDIATLEPDGGAPAPGVLVLVLVMLPHVLLVHALHHLRTGSHWPARSALPLTNTGHYPAL